MTNVITTSVLLLIIHCQISQGLSKISIGLRPYQYQYVDQEYEQKYKYKVPTIAEEDIPAFRTIEFGKMPNELEASTNPFKTMNIENTATIIPESVKPIIPKRGKQNENHVENRKKCIYVECSKRPIFDADTGTSYTPAELNKICSETVHVSKGFGISDIESFAKNNCFLIRLYYPSVTCSQINQLVGYCRENGLING